MAALGKAITYSLNAAAVVDGSAGFLTPGLSCTCRSSVLRTYKAGSKLHLRLHLC